MNTSSIPTKPSPGAMRAAYAILSHPECQAGVFRHIAEEFAAIIDRETAAPDLLAALKDTENKLRMMPGNPHWEAIAQDIQATVRAAIARVSAP